MEYCYIEDYQIKSGPRPLPKNWKNVSGLNMLSDVELRKFGWLPLEYKKDDITLDTQRLAPPIYSIKGNKVIAEYKAVDLSTEERAKNKLAKFAVKWTLERKIEALIDKIQGDPTEFNKMIKDKGDV